MDFRPMLNSDRFAYFTDQEKEYLLIVYLPRRGSDFSRSNLLYILGAFSSQLEKPLFDVSSKDASLYTKFLIGNIEEKIWREQYALTVFNIFFGMFFNITSWYTWSFSNLFIFSAINRKR